MNIQKNWATFYFVSKLEIVENLPQDYNDDDKDKVLFYIVVKISLVQTL